MQIKIPTQPTYWFCPVCGKWDSPKNPKPMATPEHRPYRGIDIGTCGGDMIPLYSYDDMRGANKRQAVLQEDDGNKTTVTTPIDDWLKKAEEHLAEYAYFSTSESYLYEACNLLLQITRPET